MSEKIEFLSAVLLVSKDSDSNYIEFTQLSERWYQHLEKRRSNGADVVSKWKSQKGYI